ncbi:hypothetical protein MRX96_033106 [Rhipicephalus microplus]
MRKSKHCSRLTTHTSVSLRFKRSLPAVRSTSITLENEALNITALSVKHGEVHGQRKMTPPKHAKRHKLHNAHGMLPGSRGPCTSARASAAIDAKAIGSTGDVRGYSSLSHNSGAARK